MHKSRLGGFIIDCQSDDLEAATGFWSAALGLQVAASAASELKYRALATAADEVHLEVQLVEHPSRVHLDIEADDIEAEVRRLESSAPGASGRSRPGTSWRRRPGSAFAWYACCAPTSRRAPTPGTTEDLQ
jgi:hypothetical protein